MPWCPKCKSEYRDGVTSCAVCGCELTEQEPEEKSFAEDDAKTFYRSTPSSVYVKKEDQYKDLQSSGFTFTFFSILGIAVLILNITGIIHLFSGVLIYTVMTILFLLFLFIGISSYRKALKVKSLIGEENDLTSEVNKWLKENVTSEFLTGLKDDTLTEEMNYLNIMEKIKEMAQAQFPGAESSLLEQLIEDFYDSSF